MMRSLLFGLVFGFCAVSATGQLRLQLRGGNVDLQPNIGKTDLIDRSRAGNIFFEGKAYVILSFPSVPDAGQKAVLESDGVEFLSFLPPTSFVVRFPEQLDQSLLVKSRVLGVYAADPSWKTSPDLKAWVLVPNHARMEGQKVKLEVLAHATMSRTELMSALKRKGFAPYGGREDSRLTQVDVPFDQVARVAGLPFVEWVEPVHPEELPVNLPGVNTHRAGILQSGMPGQRNLKGEGVVVGVGDGGYVRPHFDFDNNRLFNIVAPTYGSYGDHGDHVSGTVGGGGILNPFAKGMAPKANIITHQSSTILNASYFTNYGMVLTNNSYGFGIACPTTGNYSNYTATSVFVDNQLRNTPKLLHCFAASNDGGITPCGSYTGGFGTISLGYGTSKNALVVGAVSETDALAGFSSRGPTADGRVKPEICGVGTSVLSTIPNNTYGSKNGTSMATPGVTGTLALLYQRYKQLNGGQNPDAALIKAVACNTADDLGNANVDYRHGYGRINALRAVKVLENTTWYANSIAQGATQNVTLNLPAGLNQLRVMLYWSDREGNASANPSLVNNLNLEVIDPSATTWNPWILDPLPANCNNVAVRGVDNLNNIEQVTLSNPAAGNYTLRVTAPTVPFGPQNYYVVYEYLQPAVELTYPTGGEFLPSNIARNITWNVAGLSGGNLILEYSTNGGTNWTTISSSISVTATRFSWTPGAGFAPSNNVTLRIRHSISGMNSVSAPFTISGWPTVAASVCDRHAYLSWPAQTGAVSYDVLHFPNGEPELLANTTFLSRVVGGLVNGIEYFYAVRPVFAGFSGERSAAIKVTPSNAVACPVANDVGIFSILPTSGRQFTSTALSSTQAIQVSIKNYGTGAQTGIDVPFFYRLNGGSVQSTIFNGTLASNTATANLTFPGTADLSATGSYVIEAWTALPGDLNLSNDTLRVTIRQLANPAVNLPVTEDFESLSTQTHRASVAGLTGDDALDYTAQTVNSRLRTSAFTNMNGSGSKTITLDRTIQSTTTTYNWLVYTLNLTNHSSASQLLLNFDYVHHNEEVSNTNDRVWVRGTDAQAWVQVYDLFANRAAAGVVKQVRNLNVKALLGAQTIGTSFQIRFGQEGVDVANVWTMKGGFSFDNIQVIDPGTDLALAAITSPSGNCLSSSTQTLTVNVQNLSASALTNVPIRYQVNGGSVVSSTIPALAALTTQSFSFSPDLNLSGSPVYTIRVWVDWTGPSPITDGNRLNDTASVTVAPVVNSFPYLEDFEASNGAFSLSGTNPTWAWGIPGNFNSIVKSAASGSRVWKTNLNGVYNNSEASQITSPCINLNSSFSAGNLPVLSFNLSGSSEADYDFVWVEYSLDGISWTKLGVSGGAGSTNWYNRPSNQTWHSSMGAWKVVSYIVPAAALGANTRFRIQFTADGSVVDDGPAIDNFHIHPNVVIHDGPGDILNRTVTSTGSGNWLYFTNASGHRIAGIRDVANMGTVSLDLRQVSGTERVYNTVSYLNRNVKISPATLPGVPVPVRFFFLESEVNSLKVSDNLVKSFVDIKANKYSGPDENLSPDDNEPLVSNYTYFANPIRMPYHNGYYAEFEVSGFSEFYLSGSEMFSEDSPLPLVEAGFQAVARPEHAQIRWKSTDGSGSGIYQLLRSRDGQNFEVVANRTAEESESGQLVLDPRKGNKMLYRLVLKGSDGKDKMLGQAWVYWEKRERIELYPNPAAGQVNVRFDENPGNEPVFRLTNAIGKVWILPSAQKNSATDFQIALPELSSGLYQLEIQTGTGFQVQKLWLK